MIDIGLGHYLTLGAIIFTILAYEDRETYIQLNKHAPRQKL